jgi:tetraacyldisaccharide 4'-kinase
VAIALAELLRERGWAVDVLSRGYGREGRGVERVDLDAADAARRFGDEPVVIAQRTGAAVWVGAERFAAGVAAEAVEERLIAASDRRPGAKAPESTGFIQGAEAPCSLRKIKLGDLTAVSDVAPSSGEFQGLPDVPWRVHLLDDGFQHWGLARAVDVVLVTEEDLDDALLPAGNRRERLAALGRADVVVLREAERERVEARVRRLMRAGSAVWSVRRELQFAEGCAGARPLAFCAIARPEGFWAMLKEAGCQLAEIMAFGDHHAYAMVDVVRMVAMARQCGATGFITTEKDAVKLTNAMQERLREVGPVCVAGLTTRFVDEADVVRELEARLR